MIRSYRELAKIGRLLDERLPDYYRATVGLLALGKSIQDIDSFKTNRYFQEALGIKKMPPKEKLYYFSNTTLLQEVQVCVDMLEKQACGERIVLEHGMKRVLDDNGYVVIKDVLSPERVKKLSEIVEDLALYEREREMAYFYGKNSQRVYNLISKSQTMALLIQHPLVLEIMNHLFDRDTFHDKYYLSSWHANLVGPGEEVGKLHVDAAVPEPLPPWIIRANVMFMLDDFSEENGATRVVPVSHKMCKKPKEQNEVKTVPLEAPAGSIAIWHGHLWHQSGANKTDKNRKALLGCFAASHLREMVLEENHFKVIEDMDNLDEGLKILLGSDHGIKKGAIWK